MIKVETGLDVLGKAYWKKLQGYRIGLLCNQASMDKNLTHARDVISRLLPGNLTALFSPQHGISGEDQDNMIETDHSSDMSLKIPVYSLYSSVREPSHEMIDLIDILIIDLQDVGTRVYTFISTMLNCLRIAASANKKVLILDRPNPLGGEIIEGNILNKTLFSFVGPYSIPMRHGLTMAEIARLFNHVYRIGADLDVLTMNGWNRKMQWYDTGLKWFMPSPNMPLPETAFVYPGQVIWEGTNISEGRGTCRPFEMFGAPFLDTGLILKNLPKEAFKGCQLQEISFRPTFHKWAEELCHGFMIHISDYSTFRPYYTGISLLKEIIALHGNQFVWKEPPYEYEYTKRPIDLILGDSDLRKAIEEGDDLKEISREWSTEQNNFKEVSKPYLLYN